jgi:hypothetical protein
LLQPGVVYFQAKVLLAAPFIAAPLAAAPFIAAPLAAAKRMAGDFAAWLAEAGFSPSSSLAILAFLVVLRVLIKLFFSMLMMFFPPQNFVDIFCRYRTACFKHGKGQTLRRVCRDTAD